MPIQFTPEDVSLFWSRVLKTDSCWLWTLSKKHHGYGQVCVHPHPGANAVRVRAHRLSWVIHFGQVPDGMKVCHNCPGGDNPACVNPAHLFLGSQAENVRDMIQKGRARYVTPRGSRQHQAKLTEAAVLEIWREHSNGVTSRQLAERYGVSRHTIKAIFARHNWKHVHYAA